MPTIQFERVYDLSVMTYTDMQMHPAEEAAGARTIVERHDMPDGMPAMCGGGRGPAPGWPIYHDVQITTHTGTHVDGTWHFNKNGRPIYDFPLGAFMGPGVVLDFRHLPDSYHITGEDLEKAEPSIEEGDILIINTGRHTQFGSKEYGTLHPGLDGEAVEEFLLRKKIKMVGMDTICVEPGSEQDHWDHPLHRICLIENEILLIENVGGQIDEVTGKRCYVMAFPVLLKADSGPCRVVAFA
jgi:arylformamidase